MMKVRQELFDKERKRARMTFRFYFRTVCYWVSSIAIMGFAFFMIFNFDVVPREYIILAASGYLIGMVTFIISLARLIRIENGYFRHRKIDLDFDINRLRQLVEEDEEVQRA